MRYVREMSSRFGQRRTRAPRSSRLPIAMSLWPDTSGATSGEWKERVEVRRQVDVHVRHDRRLASEPGGAQRAPPALRVEVDRAHVRQLAREVLGDRPGRVGRGVIDHRDRGGKWKARLEI